MRISKQAP